MEKTKLFHRDVPNTIYENCNEIMKKTIENSKKKNTE